MDHSVTTGTGWLVIDESGAISHWGGEITDFLDFQIPSSKTRSFEDWANSVGWNELLREFLAIQQGHAESAQGEVDRAEQKFRWEMRALSSGTGRCVLTTLFEDSLDRCSTAGADDYRDAFHLSTVGMFRTSLNGRFIEVNEALARMYGYASPEKMLEKLRNAGRNLYVKRHRRLEFVELMRTGGMVKDFQSEITRADGSTIWITEFARTVFDGSGNPEFYEGTVFEITAHKAAEHALRASREQFRRLLETANVVPWEADIDGRIRYVGPQAEVLLGFPMGDWLEPGFWHERIHPDDKEWVKIVRDEAIENLGRFESEYRMISADGEIVWVRDIVSLIEAARGELILGGFLHDITHRRAAEESLRESQDFIEQIARASPLILYVFDTELERIVYLNGGGIAYLGRSKEELLKMQPYFIPALAHPEEIALHDTHVAKLRDIRRGEPLEREFRLRNGQGRWVWLRTRETALKVNDEGRTLQVVGVAEDITFQLAALQDLANNEALYRRLAESTRVIPFELEFEPMTFTYIGPQAETLLGFPVREWSKPDFWRSVLHPDDCVEAERSFAEAITKRDAHAEIELRLRDQTGKYHWIRQILRCEVVEQEFSRARGFFVDISAAKAMETEREESRRELRDLALENQRAREEERRALSREIHDELGQVLTLLRIDLTWLGGRVSKALRSGPAGPLLGKIEEMEQQIATTLQIVRRITTQLRPPVLDEFGLSEAIEWQANDFSRRVGVRCEVSTQFADCPCKDTATMVFRIFQELLTNVARHSKASRVRVFLKQMGGIIYLSVSDNGCGFEVQTARQNAGFGLLGMRERAESVRGRLQIESTIGIGTTVTLCVPLNGQSQIPL